MGASILEHFAKLEMSAKPAIISAQLPGTGMLLTGTLLLARKPGASKLKLTPSGSAPNDRLDVWP